MIPATEHALAQLHELPVPFYCALPDWAVVSVSGAEAATFLHRQVTSDVQQLPPAQLQLTGLCNAKGRLFATPWLYRLDRDSFLLLVPREGHAELITHLQKYVMRSKVSIALTTHSVYGAVSSPSASAAPFPLTAAHTLPLSLALDGVATRYQRQLYLCLAEQPLADVIAVAPQAPTAQWWDALALLAYTPTVGLAQRERFIPQTLRLDKLGAVSFTKGCYPGQEIVARTHYLGKAKRATYLVTSAIPLPIGQAITTAPMADTASDSINPLGQVVNCAALPNFCLSLLELQTDAYNQALATNELLFCGTTPVTLLPAPVSG